MLIRLLTNIGSRDTDIAPLPREGDELAVDERTGQRFVARGWAEDITPLPPVIQAVPAPPLIADPQPPEIEPPHMQAERDLKAYKARQLKTSTGPKQPAVLPVKPPTKQEP